MKEKTEQSLDNSHSHNYRYFTNSELWQTNSFLNSHKWKRVFSKCNEREKIEMLAKKEAVQIEIKRRK